MDRGLGTVGRGRVVKDRHRQSLSIVTEGERCSPYVFALRPGSLVLGSVTVPNALSAGVEILGYELLLILQNSR